MDRHTRKCRDCGNIAEYEDSITPWVLCKRCWSQDTRRITTPADKKSMLQRAIASYESHRSALKQIVTEMFPVGSIVQYELTQGVVFSDEACPPDIVPVLFESGNVWDKPADQLTRVTDESKFAPWIKRRPVESGGGK